MASAQFLYSTSAAHHGKATYRFFPCFLRFAVILFFRQAPLRGKTLRRIPDASADQNTGGQIEHSNRRVTADRSGSFLKRRNASAPKPPDSNTPPTSRYVRHEFLLSETDIVGSKSQTLKVANVHTL